MRLFIGLFYLLLFPFALIAQTYSGISVNLPQKSTRFIKQNSRNTFEVKHESRNPFLGPQLLLSDASILVAQTTICPDWQALEELQEVGIKSWIDAQIAQPYSFFGEKVKFWQLILAEQTDIDPHTSSLAFHLAKWQNVLTAKDQLRQRMAWALDEVLKRTLRLDPSQLSAEAQGRYADVLIRHALGNYQDLLREILADPDLNRISEYQALIPKPEREALGKQLFNHPHTGYQFAAALIEELLGQKPEDEFIRRVSQVFENNGRGERGDLSAVTYAIFSDPKAEQYAKQGKPLDKALAMEPLLKYSFLCDFLNQMNLQELSVYFEEENKVLEEGEMAFLRTPDFLSFYYPFEESLDDLESVEPSSPAQQVLGFIKEVEHLEDHRSIYIETNPEEGISEELDAIIKLSEKPEELLDYLDILFVQGLLSDTYKNQIIETIKQISNEEDRFSMALYLIFISPDYKNVS